MIAASFDPSNLTPSNAERLREASRRIAVLRQGLLDAGIQLPALRNVDQRDEPVEQDVREYTIPQIARWADLDRTTVLRRLRRFGGELEARYTQARQEGCIARFTLEEAAMIAGLGE